MCLILPVKSSSPQIHQLLEQRAALKLDFDSYSRRANTEHSKDATNASSKLVIKRDNAALKLTEITTKIREHLDDLEQRRPSMLVSELSALLGIQQSLASKQSETLSELLPAVPHAAVTICALAHADANNAETTNFDS